MDISAEIVGVGVEAFRSYEQAHLRLAPLTLLVGPNASGKSNFIEALRLLSWLARGQRLDQFAQSAANGDLGVRGDAESLPRDGQDAFRISCTFQHDNEWVSADTLSVQIRVTDSGLRVWDEVLGFEIQGRPLYAVRPRSGAASHDIEAAYDTLRDQGTVPCTDEQLVLNQLRTPAAFGAMGERAGCIPAVARAFGDALSRVLFLRPDPRRMRDYVHYPAQALERDGGNVSAVLYGLCKAQEREAEVLEFVRGLPEDDISGIGFVKTELDDVMVQVTESFGGRGVPREARLISDGTLRVLAVAAAVLSAPVRSLVVIEEVDSSVHPSRARALIEAIRRVALERNLSVLLTSHNPALLDALPIEAIPDVACCFRDPETGWSRLVRLGDSERYAELVAQGTVGRLMTHGILERILRDTRTSEERKADALHWIEERRRKLS